MLIVFIGPSAAGKDSLQKIMISEYCVKKITTYTTRNRRPGENDGVDYHFISNEEFNVLRGEGFFAETAEYSGGRFYGSSITSIKIAAESEDLYTIILTPQGYRKIKQCVKEDDICSVYVTAPLKDRVVRYIHRCGDEFNYSDLTEIQERVNRDFGMFLGVEDEVDFVYNNKTSCDFEKDIRDILHVIISNIEKRRDINMCE